MTRHILISGASSGIGKAAAQSLASDGHTVFAGALNEAEAQAMREEGIRGIVPVVLDVTRMESINAAIGIIRETGDGHLDGLVNCAGVDINAPLQVLEHREIMQMIDVNLTGGIMLTRAALPLLRPDAARLVFISSTMALMSTPTISIYSATKCGIEGFADALRVELVPLGIKVAIIEPGVIRTPLVEIAPRVTEQILLRMSADERSLYEPMMRGIAKLSGPQAGSSTTLTSNAITHALTASKPRIRYRVGADCKAVGVISHLPYRLQDWLQCRLFGISHRRQATAGSCT